MNDKVQRALKPNEKRINAIVTLDWIDQIHEWRRHQPDIPTVSESIRRLVVIGINSQKRERR